MPVLAFNPFVSTDHRRFLCDLWWREINLVITERLDNRASFCRLICKSLQFLLLYV